MSAEKEIVDYWLNSKGYLTIRNISVKNKDIGILATKVEDGKIDASYFAVSCSITSSALETKDAKKNISQYIDDNFDNPLISKRINDLVAKYIGQTEHHRILVLGSIPKAKRNEIIELFKEKDIEVIEFPFVMREVMQELDTHYYKDEVIRALQLVKYLLLSQPQHLAELLKGTQSITKQHKMDTFMSSLLKQDSTMKAFKKADEEELKMLLKHPLLQKPEVLARLLLDNVLGKKQKKKFLKEFLKHDKIKKMFRKEVGPENLEDELTKKQKHLRSFFSKAE